VSSGSSKRSHFQVRKVKPLQICDVDISRHHIAALADPLGQPVGALLIGVIQVEGTIFDHEYGADDRVDSGPEADESVRCCRSADVCQLSIEAGPLALSAASMPEAPLSRLHTSAKGVGKPDKRWTSPRSAPRCVHLPAVEIPHSLALDLFPGQRAKA